MSILCAISTFTVNNVGFYFLTFDCRYLGPLMDLLSLITDTTLDNLITSQAY